MAVLQRVVYISVFSISTPVTLRMQKASSQLSLVSSLVDRHNVRSLALNIVMKPGLLSNYDGLTLLCSCFLNSNERWGTEKSWAELEQAELVHP